MLLDIGLSPDHMAWIVDAMDLDLREGLTGEQTPVSHLVIS